MVPSGAETSKSADRRTIISVQNPQGHLRLDALIESLRRPPIQHRQESTLISSDRDLGLSSGYYLPDQIDQELDSIDSGAGTSLEVTPSVLARVGETATLEIISEFHSLNTDGESEKTWTGLQIISQIDAYGFGYRPQIKLETRPGTVSHHPLDSIFGQSQFDFNDIAPSAHALVKHQTTPDGQHQYLITRITPIDATGRPVPPRGESSP